MKYKFYTFDVFTEVRFGGNPLAVLPNAKRLSSQQMQQIAREFNYSESTFVLPSDNGYTKKVRIFTPTKEVPFAGHPNIGTAFTLAAIGELGSIGAETNITFEEQAGPVPIVVRKTAEDIWCELKAPESLFIQQTVSPDLAAAALTLTSSDIVTTTHPPRVASVGLPFLVVELKHRTALKNARCYMPAFDEIHAQGIMPDIHVYIRSNDEFDLRARMFAPLDGVPEDPATGSANCALAAMLGHYQSESAGDFAWRIAQGAEMQRPSVLEARVEKRSGTITGVWIGGCCKLVAEGYISV